MAYGTGQWEEEVLGQFLAPDTIVPAAGNALDYHRYAYTRFNPVRYEDDSGHCATLANGQADENDADCWRLARTIGNLWNVTDYWRTRFGELDVWNNHVAPSGVNAEFMQSELSTYLKSDAYADLVVTISLTARSLTAEDPRAALAVGILQLTWDAFLSSDERW